MNTYHGDIFYIANDGRAGETPAIIVSPDTWLEQDPEFVQAVLMTTKENEQLLTHVEVIASLFGFDIITIKDRRTGRKYRVEEKTNQ